MTSNFRFDQNKSFAENSEAFLEAVSTDDPDMAAILRANWDGLIAIYREGERSYDARKRFNASVASALNALVASSVPKEKS